MRTRRRAGRGSAARVLCLAVVLAGPSARAQDATPPELSILGDDTVVTTSVRVRPGTYRVRDANGDGVLHVARDGVTVDLDGVTLLGSDAGATPDAFEGVGISVVGARGVTLRGGTIRGFRVNVRAARCEDLRLANVGADGSRAMRLRSTPAREDPADWLWPHENDAGQWETRYGAGISLTDCPGARVEACRAQRAQNGLLLSRCDGALVQGCDFSRNSGWGIALWRTNRAVVEHNRCDWCVRGYSHGVYARGQDSAGILVFEQCSENRFEQNSATHSGDGFFLYAGHETTQRTGEGGSNRNVLRRNDFSHAVANGIEATFSVGNVFLENRLDDCDHGIWAGYSSRTMIRGNRIEGCANGVSIEHGQDNLILGNLVTHARRGVHLWWDEDKDLLASAFGRKRSTDSLRNRIEGNSFADCDEPIRLDGDRESVAQRNRIVARDGKVVDEGPGGPLEPPVPEKHWKTSPPYLDPATRRGRAEILVDEWGPVDPAVPRLFPVGPGGGPTAAFRVLGPPGARYSVLDVAPGVRVEPMEGRVGESIRVGPAPDADAESLVSFQFRVRIGEERRDVAGTLWQATWNVTWRAWAADPREGAEAWARTLAGPPLATEPRGALDWAGSGAPAKGVPPDRFATVATTTVKVPLGRYRFRIVSDDGVRLQVDGRTVFEDWTWHGPKEDVVEVDLSGGAHDLRVEHFEIDGYAALRLSLERLP